MRKNAVIRTTLGHLLYDSKLSAAPHGSDDLPGPLSGSHRRRDKSDHQRRRRHRYNTQNVLWRRRHPLLDISSSNRNWNVERYFRYETSPCRAHRQSGSETTGHPRVRTCGVRTRGFVCVLVVFLLEVGNATMPGKSTRSKGALSLASIQGLGGTEVRCTPAGCNRIRCDSRGGIGDSHHSLIPLFSWCRKTWNFCRVSTKRMPVRLSLKLLPHRLSLTQR